jgi:hypothetical protein
MPIVTPGTFSMAALATEVTTDPIAMGYAALGGNPSAVTLLLNQKPEPSGVTGGQESIYRKTTPTIDLVACIIPADYTALTATQRDLCALVFSTEVVKTGDATLRTLVVSIFAAGTTRTNLTNAASRLCSRAEALWGDGFSVSDQQVYTALGGV